MRRRAHRGAAVLFVATLLGLWGARGPGGGRAPARALGESPAAEEAEGPEPARFDGEVGDADDDGDAPAVTAEQVADLVRRMGAAKYRTRQAAHAELDALGPAVVPYLQEYKDHDSAEVRTRVDGLLRKHGWVRTGAVIVQVIEGTQADRLGFRMGDVVLRVDDTDVADSRIFRELPRDKVRAYYLWRSGKILRKTVQPGQVGYGYAPWSLKRGGLAHAKAFEAIEQKRYEQAYALIKQALRRGADDWKTNRIAAALAEMNLCHTHALELYEATTPKDYFEDKDWMPAPSKARGGVHRYVTDTKCLLDYMADPKNAEDLTARKRAVFYASNRINHYSLAKQLAAREKTGDPPHEWDSSVHLAAGLLAHHDGKLLDACRHFKAADSYFGRDWGPYVLPATRDLDALVRAVEETRLSDESRGLHWINAAAATSMAGDTERAERVLEMHDQLPPEVLRYTVRFGFVPVLTHRSILPHIKDRLIATCREHGGKSAPLTALLLTVTDDDFTAETWQNAWEEFGPECPAEASLRKTSIRLMALMRLGRYDDVCRIVEVTGKRKLWKYQGTRVLYAARWFLDDPSRLERDPRLRDLVMLRTGIDCLWGLCWDGKVLRIEEGRITEPPGIFPDMPWLPVASEGHGFRGETGTILTRRSCVYLYDAQRQRWRRSYVQQRSDSADLTIWCTINDALFLRHFLDHYETGKPGMHIGPRDSRGPWHVYRVHETRQVLMQMKEHKFIDLAQEISRLSGVEKVLVGEATRLLSDQYDRVVTSSAGLWGIPKGGDRLERVPLKIREPNQWIYPVEHLAWRKKLYLGFVPEDGGDVFEVGPDTLEMRRVDAFNGIGPVSLWRQKHMYSSFLLNEACLYPLYEERLAREAKANARAQKKEASP